MSINLNDIIIYGNAKFQVVKIATNNDITNIQNQLNSVTYDYVPIGVIFPFCGNTIPNSYLLCDGSVISRTTYNKLFNVIGTIYGTGDNSTTFNLPNLIDKFIEGSSTAGINIDAGLPNIKGEFKLIGDHQWCDPSDWSGSGAIISVPTSSYSYLRGGSDFVGGEPRYGFRINASSYNSIYSDSVNTVQPKSLTMKYIIKAF